MLRLDRRRPPESSTPTATTIRFTPRRARSVWSSINIRRVKVLSKEGRMSAAGLAAYQRRSQDRSAIYAYEQRASAKLTPAETRIFKAEPEHGNTSPRSRRRTVTRCCTGSLRRASPRRAKSGWRASSRRPPQQEDLSHGAESRTDSSSSAWDSRCWAVCLGIGWSCRWRTRNVMQSWAGARVHRAVVHRRAR